MADGTEPGEAEVGEDLRSITSTIDRRVAAVERNMCRGGKRIAVDTSASVGIICAGPGTGPRTAAGEDKTPGEPDVDGSLGATAAGHGDALSLESESCVPSEESEETTAETKDQGTATLLNSPKWSMVVKQGRRMRAGSARSKPRNSKEHERKRPKPIYGTGAQSNIKACERIATGNTRCSSFKVSVECEDVSEVYNPELWPEGSLVRRYYEPRRVQKDLLCPLQVMVCRVLSE
ncbi:hypothetical protein WMY93_016534 [Mugilogobius chulae]|uniref:Uncharacterized protein n=1 Tax=Mugilogobius chulae TaxID=88201 RepID=A0AAW0NVV9_9GOBI